MKGAHLMSERCCLCDGYHIHWWRKTLAWHVARTLSLAIGIVRKPWWPESDDPFSNIHWSLAWEVSRGIHWKERT